MPTTPTRPDPVAAVVVEDAGWHELGIAALARRAVGATLAHLGVAAAGREVVVLACDDARIAALNAAFMEATGPTDVLSWPSVACPPDADGAWPALAAAPPPGALGDIALARETCLADADALGRPAAAHLTHLVVHGCLHLVGFDHARARDSALMRAQEAAILAKLGVPDPYTFGQAATELQSERNDGPAP